MGRNGDIAICPFCPFSDPETNFVEEHIEYCHPENSTQSKAGHSASPENLHGANYEHQQLQSSIDEDHMGKYVDCPHGCGELVANLELSTHLDLHFAEGIALDNADITQTEPGGLGTVAPDSDESPNDETILSSYKSSAKGLQKKGESPQSELRKGNRGRRPNSTPAGDVKRLGRAELGPHAHEKRMPSWLRRMLEKGAKTTQSNQITSDGMLSRHETVENETTGIIPVLAQLCEQDKSIQRAFFCSPKVSHVFKMPREGGFCGYRNIQMLVSYIQGSQSTGHEEFSGKLPTILELQDMIEKAWDMGFNSVGRVETGGIRGTRKFIGTPEAQALFTSLGIPCEANSISETNKVRGYDALYMNIASYFQPAFPLDGNDKKVITTSLPPIYFQHQGHSLTIIGFEIRENGRGNLLVFDPMFKTSPAIKRLVGTNAKSSDPARLLKAHRRGAAYLQKYKVFEILKLSIPDLETYHNP